MLLLGLGLAIRRIVLRRFLELGLDAVSLPTGFLRMKSVKISYADILAVQEVRLGRTTVLKLRTQKRSFEIVSVFMANNADYTMVTNFFNSLPAPKEIAASLQNQPVQPGKYCFQCSYEGDGGIYDSRGEIVGHSKTQHFKRLPDFVIYDKSDNELIRIKRDRGFVVSRFVMIENGIAVCRITQRSILLNRYQLVFADGATWKFHMPLFTVIFKGWSETGARIRVRLRSHNVWYVMIDSEADNPRLVAALAFIHRERLRCN